MKIIKKILGMICLIEVFLGIYLTFTVFRDEPIAGISVCSIFGFLAYLLLRKRTNILLPEDPNTSEMLSKNQRLCNVKKSDRNTETNNNTTYRTEKDSASKQLEVARESLNASLNQLNKALSSGNILKVTVSQSANTQPSPKPKAGGCYIEDGEMIIRTDGKEISDEEVPYLIQVGYEKAIENQTRLKTDLPLDLNEQEQCFFNELKLVLSDIKRNITAKRMSSGVISVYSNTFYVGKIKLSGRKHWMQILRGQTQIKVIDGELDDFIQHIPDWVRYIRIHCK